MSDNTEINGGTNERELNDILRVRREKLAELQSEGRDPFKITKYDRTHSSADVKNDFDAGVEYAVNFFLTSVKYRL